MFIADVDEESLTEHSGLHSDEGARSREHPGRAANPTIKATGLAWLEFDKPDLDRAQMFARDFGLVVHHRDDDSLYLRGHRAGTPCMVIRKAPQARFRGLAFQAADPGDLQRFADEHGTTVRTARDVVGGSVVTVRDPNGVEVSVAHGQDELPDLPRQLPLVCNVAGRTPRVNAAQRPVREPARAERLGHLAMASRTFSRTLDWYLQNFGLIVSDFQFLDGQRDRGPVFAFIRCDRGSEPTDHHTLALLLAPEAGYAHSAYEVADLDALAAGGEYLRERKWTRSWGIGRHVQGSQIFDYWRDPERFMVEHYADGDVFDNTVPAGWAPLRASGLSQWGPPATKDFLGNKPSPTLVRTAVQALREDNEIDAPRLKALVKALSR